MNRFLRTALETLAAAGLVACEWTVPCPEGYRYDHERRVCVDIDGMWDAGGQTPPRDSGRPPEPDAGSGEVDAGSGEVDAGSGEVDAGSGEVDAGGGKVDAGGGKVDAGGGP
jgi:hypothetical protein